MSKRGVSDLIATVLIIGLVIALAAVIIGFSQRFVSTTIQGTEKESAASLECIRNVGIRIEDACKITGSNNLRVRLENNKQATITGVLLRVHESDQGVSTISEDGNLVGGATAWNDLNTLNIMNYDFDFKKATDKVVEVEVFPKITGADGKEVICEGQKDTRVVRIAC